eukprot:TRINITY_DN2134_c0_g1_i1.p1 TRINITY_DN2134_c0_g1~~TRINITY_DN2134_c0_g1_i1.p1  ORF type:complete len:197 (-),score=35.34 TRINITY_DN2134_c0_g1_i1:15-605(-)
MDDYRHVMDVNFFGGVEVTKTFLPLVKKQKGRIINLTSIAGRLAGSGMSSYAASKFAFEGFTDSLRREVSLWGVKVVLIEPTFMNTPMVQNIKPLLQRHISNAPKKVIDEYGSAFLDHMIEVNVDSISKITHDPIDVIDALEEALFSKYPKSRYLVGWDAKALLAPLTLFPAGVSDLIISQILDRNLDLKLLGKNL